jgi:NAD(P)-dependent dehydrogenase (short-subunit alcohol dehydrogenase family)
MVNKALDRLLERSVVGSFTKLGYSIRRREYRPLPSMEGKTVVITGATSGLGKAAAAGLLEIGAEVVVVARNESKAKALEVDGYYIGDLSLMSDVRRVAQEILDDHQIDVLINNAGALFGERLETSEGLEQTFALDLLSPYLLTNLLRPAMQPGSRIINIASGGMYTARLSLSNLQNQKDPYKGAAAYARAKRALVILTELWAERWPDLVVHAMHPGWADTKGLESALPVFRRVIGPLLRTPEEGADTMVWLAAADEPGESSGEFWHDRAVRSTHFSDRTKERPSARSELVAALDSFL